MDLPLKIAYLDFLLLLNLPGIRISGIFPAIRPKRPDLTPAAYLNLTAEGTGNNYLAKATGFFMGIFVNSIKTGLFLAGKNKLKTMNQSYIS